MTCAALGQAIYAALVLTTAILIPPHGLPYNLGQADE